MPTARPLYLGTGRNQAAALYSPPSDGAPARAAVVICSPWGWDEVASYRSRRRWAERLAAAGHPTLRFDLPAWGDSDGTPADENLLDAWVEAVAVAAAWLRAEAGAPRVALLGLGLGGLLAREAIVRGASSEELILWGAPRSGKAFVREARAFSALQEWSGDGAAEAAAGAGALEAGGFVLSGETRAALTELDPTPAAGGKLRRALLLGRDGVGAEEELAAAFEAAGVAVVSRPGDGWGELVVHPEQTQLSSETADAVERWLAAAESDGDGGTTAEPVASADSLSILVGATEIKETPLRVELEFGAAYGVLAEPVGEGRNGTCAIFLNSGAVRHAGPDRLWTEAARSSAAAGVPALRIDLEGIGEADGDEVRLRRVGEFFDGRYAEQALGVIEKLSRAGVAEQFILIGLCSGAYWSFRAALGSPRVRRALMINSGALVWRPDLYTDRGIRDLSRLRDPAWWKRLLTGKLSRKGAREGAQLVWGKLRQVARRLLQKLRPDSSPEAGAEPNLEADLDRLERQGTRVTLAFSEGEMLLGELEADGTLELLRSRPGVQLEQLPGGDHTLRPLGAQAAAQELIGREILATQQEMPELPPKSSPAGA
ncbi:MAG: hypothetical protein QOE75_12 [Solirubrobacterales bacterium]|nr:hypothetical protein [Solirubrobacterales bacterium]